MAIPVDLALAEIPTLGIGYGMQIFLPIPIENLDLDGLYAEFVICPDWDPSVEIRWNSTDYPDNIYVVPAGPMEIDGETVSVANQFVVLIPASEITTAQKKERYSNYGLTIYEEADGADLFRIHGDIYWRDDTGPNRD